MSLINQVLQDLEKRHASAESGALARAVRPLPEERARRGLWIGLGVIAIALVAGTGAWWWTMHGAQLLSPSLRSRDYPPDLRRRLSDGASPFVIFTVLPNGRVTGCRIYQSSGDPVVDDMTCRLVSARFVYRPAYNRRGEPVSSQMAYRQAN